MENARKAWIADAESDEERQRRQASNILKYKYHDGSQNIYADFHSLRHTGITAVNRAAGLKVAQDWADHSTPALTARYVHVELSERREALKGLPKLDGLFGDKGRRKRAV